MHLVVRLAVLDSIPMNHALQEYAHLKPRKIVDVLELMNHALLMSTKTVYSQLTHKIFSIHHNTIKYNHNYLIMNHHNNNLCNNGK